MSYGEYSFGDFRKYYEGGPSDALVGFAQGFAQGFVPAYTEAVKQRRQQEDDMFKLAIKDIQAQEKLKADATTKSSGYTSKAARLAKLFPNLPGVEAYIYNGLRGGMTSNQIVSDLQAGVKEGRIRATDSTGNTYNPLESTEDATPAPANNTNPAPENDKTSSLETQTQSAFEVAENNNPSASEFLINRFEQNQGQSSDLPDGSYMEADASGTGWIDRWNQRRLSSMQSNVDKRVEQWKALTGRTNDVTTSDGLTGSNTTAKISVEDVASNSNTLETVGTVLSIIPKAEAGDDPESALDLKPVNEIDSVEDAIVARSVAESQPDNPESSDVIAIADKLITDLTEAPTIGEMTVADLDILINSDKASLGPKYSGMNDDLFKRIQKRATALRDEKIRLALPSLNFENSSAGEAVLADINAGRIKVSGFPKYVTELKDRIEALQIKEQAEAVKGDNFDMDDYENLKAQMVIKLQKTPGGYDAWLASQGKILEGIAKQAESRADNETLAGINNPEQRAVAILTASDEFQAMNSTAQIDALNQLREKFNPASPQSLNLTRGDVAGRLAEANRILADPSSKPEQIAAANQYIKILYPIDIAAVEATAAKKPDAEIPESLVTIRNDQGIEEKIYGKVQEDGSVIVSSKRGVNGEKITIPADQVISSMSMESADMINQQLARLPSSVQDAIVSMQDSTKFAVQAKRLDDIVKRNEEVLQIGGRLQAGFGTFKTQAGSLINAIGQIATGDDLKGASPEMAKGAIRKQIEEMIDGLNASDEVKRAYKEFASQSILLVFSAGAAVGQTGNGFSNKDFEVLQRALTGATTYVEFTNQLRAFTKNGLDAASAQITALGIDPRVANTQDLPGVNLDILQMNAEKYLKDIYKQPGVYEWSQGRVEPEPEPKVSFGRVKTYQDAINAGTTTIEAIEKTLRDRLKAPEAEIDALISQLKPKSEEQ